MASETAYDALIAAAAEPRWAYGTGFADPLAGVSTELPAGVDRQALASSCVQLGDDSLVYAQRLAGWITRLPELEEETAIANIALDHLGQARWLYTRAGQLEGRGRTEDDFAYRREPAEFRNVCLVELPDEHFGVLVVRLLVVSLWRGLLMRTLTSAPDPVLAALAGKASTELAYHREYAADWVVRLGDGTALSHERAQEGLVAVLPWLDELFAGASHLRADFDAALTRVLTRATLPCPPVPPAAYAGRQGRHTAALGPLVDELQSVAREHPGACW